MFVYHINDLRKLPHNCKVQAKCLCFQSGYLWVEAVENIPLPDASLWCWILNENKAKWNLFNYNQQTHTSTRSGSCYKRKFKTCKCEGIGCISMSGYKRSLDLNRRWILLVFYRYLLYPIINIYFLTMVHKNQFTPIGLN